MFRLTRQHEAVRGKVRAVRGPSSHGGGPEHSSYAMLGRSPPSADRLRLPIRAGHGLSRGTHRIASLDKSLADFKADARVDWQVGRMANVMIEQTKQQTDNP